MKKKNKKSVKIKIFEKIHIKIICFFLAVIVFFLVNFTQRSSKTFSSDLNIINLKEYLVISNNIPKSVKVQAKDKAGVLNKIENNDFNVRLDLINVNSPSSAEYRLKWDIPKEMNSFFSTIKIEPEAIFLDIENLTEKNVPIKISQIGDVRDGYTINNTTIYPESIRIRGPEKIINNIEYIETEGVFIGGATESFKRAAVLYSPYESIEFIGPDKVDIYFEILKEVEIATFKYVGVRILNLKNHFDVEQKKRLIYIQVRGLKSNIQNLKSKDIILSVDCSDIIIPGEYTKKVNVSLPHDIELLSITPSEVKMTVKDKE